MSAALGCGLLATAQAGRGTRPLVVHVQEALGAQPADCGYFNAWVPGDEPRPDRLAKALACITGHARKAAPAWLRIYRQGFDSQVATGLMVGTSGDIRLFTYDSDPSGGSSAGSAFAEAPCPAPDVASEGFNCPAP